MLFRCTYHHKNLYWKKVKYETIDEYVKGIKLLEQNGWKINAIVCDGKKGFFYAFDNIPIQMCQYHQISIIRRYLTQNPKLIAGIELKKLTLKLTKIDKNDFVNELNIWELKWKDFVNEKTINFETGKKHFKHKRLRSAYKSIKNNLHYLFTYQDYPHLFIPNTNNETEGIFSNLKKKINVHQGLKRNRKIKLINEILN